jgi:hypothetical protein
MLGHEKLRAWQLCHELAIAIYRATERWPKEERYGLTAQLRRAVASAPTNLAEGSAREGESAGNLLILPWDQWPKLLTCFGSPKISEYSKAQNGSSWMSSDARLVV